MSPNNPPPLRLLPDQSSASGRSGQHHVDRRPLVPISAPPPPEPPRTVSVSPMAKRPRRVPFHISSSARYLPLGALRWLSRAEFPKLWSQSLLIEWRNVTFFLLMLLKCLSCSPRSFEGLYRSRACGYRKSGHACECECGLDVAAMILKAPSGERK